MAVLGVLALMLGACSPMSSRLRDGLSEEKIVAEARKQIGVPYKYGGKTPEQGFDCSGLVGYVYRKAGTVIPWGTKAQYQEGRKVPKGELKPGDLLFFDIDGHGVSHVGIYLGHDKMVHAPSSGSKVREESLDIKYWIQRYLGARRLD